MAAILLDTNVLVHAAYRGAEHHRQAAALLDRGLRRRGLFCVAPQNIIEFASVVTRSRFVDPPLGPEEVHRMAGILWRSRSLAKIYPKRGTVIRALREGRDLKTRGPAWYDLFLALTMRDAGIHAIVTENAKDFSPIPGLTTRSIAEMAESA